MQKGLMKLNEEELNWLSNYSSIDGGRIGTIDVQRGCPIQCIVCGANAQKYLGSMSWKDFMIISDSILEVKIKKGFDVLSEDRIFPNHSSDITTYHSRDGAVEKTAYHIITDLIIRHNKEVDLTTAGWKPGNNHMQKAMEDIVENYSLLNSKLSIGYSIKTVSEQIIREYSSFLEHQEQHYNKKVSNLEFIRNSKYISRIVNNINTLAPLNITGTIGYEFQYLNYKDINALDIKYDQYRELFSQNFMDQFEQHFDEEWYYSAPVNSKNVPYTKPIFYRREFEGVGKILNMGNIDMILELQENQRRIHSNSREYINEDRYIAQIESNGAIQIYYGMQNLLGVILVPKEHFTTIARQENNKKEKRKYEMLANLQGKNILT